MCLCVSQASDDLNASTAHSCHESHVTLGVMKTIFTASLFNLLNSTKVLMSPLSLNLAKIAHFIPRKCVIHF